MITIKEIKEAFMAGCYVAMLFGCTLAVVGILEVTLKWLEASVF